MADDDPVTSGEAAAVLALASFEETYRACYGRLTRVAHLILGSNEVAEEIVQDAFVALYPRFASVQSPEAYLRRTVVNGCRAWIRRKQTGYRLARPEVAITARAPELDETWAALDRLTPGQRTAVVLRYYGDLSLAEIAELTGTRVGTVKSQLHRALAQLKEVLAP
ncbi:MAG TPA: SigE family RNA polymerase sigma factor [Acidimicrobiales bacterium]